MGVGDESYYSWNHAAAVGIRCIHNFKLRELPHHNLQLILVDNLPHPDETWHHFITKRFDINIVRGTAEIGNTNSLGNLTFGKGPLSSINLAAFTYTINPTVSFNTTLNRILKCTKRGFRLLKISFHSKISPANKRCIVHRFYHIMGPKICMKWFAESDLTGEFAIQLFDFHVLPFLRHDYSLDLLFRRTQEEHFRASFQKLGWNSPGLEQFRQEDIEECIEQQKLTEFEPCQIPPVEFLNSLNS